MEEQKPENLQPYEKSTHHLPLKNILFNNFIGGIAWAFGATVGLSLIVWGLTMIAKNVNLVPIVGSFTSDVINFIISNNPNIPR